MRAFKRISLLIVLYCLFASGCGGDSMIKARGKITKGGKPFSPSTDQALRVFLAPVKVEGQSYDSFAARFDPKNGTFEVVGKDGQGLPPGQYRVDLELMHKKDDVWGGKLMGVDKSPFTCEVARGKEIVVNLDEAHLD